VSPSAALIAHKNGSTAKPGGMATVMDLMACLALVIAPSHAALPLQFSIVKECALSVPAATEVGAVVAL
jgi:hypothetical protein